MTVGELRAWLIALAAERATELPTQLACGRLLALVDAAHPPGRYRCGCPAVRSDNVKLFCPAHHKILGDVAVPDAAACGGDS